MFDFFTARFIINYRSFPVKFTLQKFISFTAGGIFSILYLSGCCGFTADCSYATYASSISPGIRLWSPISSGRAVCGCNKSMKLLRPLACTGIFYHVAVAAAVLCYSHVWPFDMHALICICQAPKCQPLCVEPSKHTLSPDRVSSYRCKSHFH